MQPGGTALGWARFASRVAASITVVFVLLVLATGYAIVTTDWRVLECFDGTEPACDEPAEPYGLSTVQTSSWILAAVAVVAALSAFVWSFRLLRPVHLAPALLLCAAAAAIASVLWARLA